VIAFCIDKDQLTTELLEGVREAFPQASVFVRAFDRRTIIKLRGAQVQEMVREVMESAVVMGRAALDGLGLSLQEIERAENSYRTRDKERLDVQLEGGDLRAGKERFMPREGGQVGEPDVTPQHD
jgi:glutathione-regulated potassium-efflux system protein KefB